MNDLTRKKLLMELPFSTQTCLSCQRLLADPAATGSSESALTISVAHPKADPAVTQT